MSIHKDAGAESWEITSEEFILDTGGNLRNNLEVFEMEHLKSYSFVDGSLWTRDTEFEY